MTFRTPDLKSSHVAFLAVVLFFCFFIIAKMLQAEPEEAPKPLPPQEVQVVQVVYRPAFVSRENVNEALMEVISSGNAEWVYRFYDEFTGDRYITFVLVNAALLYDVPVNLLMGLAWRESSFNPDAVNINANGTKDYGLLMLHEKTFPGLKPEILLDPKHNALIGVQYFLGRYRKRGTWELAVVAYNGGTGERVAESSLFHLSSVMLYEREIDAALAMALEELHRD